MNLLHDDLARAHQRALLADSAALRQGREIVLARRLARRSEQTAPRRSRRTRVR